MNLTELYKTIVSREDLPYASLKPKMRIAVVMPTGELDVMKIDRIGEGHASLEEEMRYMAIAKVCPGQSSMTLGSDGSVHLNDLIEVYHPADPYGTSIADPHEQLGVLGQYGLKYHWMELDENTIVKKLTKSEMREIQGALP